MIYLGKNIDDQTYVENFFSRNYYAIFALYITLGVCGAYFGDITFTQNISILIGAYVLLALLYVIVRGEAKRFFLYHIGFNVLVLCLLFSFGGIITHNKIANVYYQWSETKELYQVRIIDEIKRSSSSVQYKAIVENSIINDSLFEVNRNVILFAYPDSSLSLTVGDELLLNTVFSLPDKDPISSFDYNRYLIAKNISATAFISNKDYQKISNDTRYNLSTISNTLRIHLARRIDSNKFISKENSALINSILLGDKSQLPLAIKETFSSSGASHILAVSGMHVGIIYGIYLLVFSSIMLRRNSRLRYLLYIILLVILWVYAFITGLSPSVVRASLMFSLFLIDRYIFGERFEGKVIAFAFIVMVVYNPLVIFDIGFQLSFAAVISIIAFAPYISSYFRFNGAFQYKILQIFIIPIAAQLGTFPLVLFYFHQFPTYFLLSNILITFCAPIIMYGGLLFLIIGDVSVLGVVLAKILNICVEFFSESILYISGFHFATIQWWLEWWHIILLYILIIYLFLLVRKFSYQRLYKFLITLLFCYVVFVVSIYIDKGTEGIFIPRNKQLIVNVVKEGSNVVFTNDSIVSERLLSDIWLKNKTAKPYYQMGNSLQDNCFMFHNTTYIILRDGVLKNAYNQSNEPLGVDVVIVDKGIYPSEVIFSRVIRPKQKIICTYGVSTYYLDKYKALADKMDIEFYSVREDGSFVRLTNTPPL